MDSTGRALHTLRMLSGLSLADVASRAKLDKQRVQKAERRSPVDPSVLKVLSGVYGVDPNYLAGEHKVAAFDGAASLFLFSGDVRDVSVDDLPFAATALDRARVLAQSEAGLAGVRLRLERSPSAPSGPRARDAAIQGHVLARDLRAALKLTPEAPVDFAEVLPRLGIVAISASLTSETLRAIAVLDQDRAAAAVVLNDRVRDGRTQLHRVALAHEICHLVYDPISPNTCNLTLDEMQERGRSLDLRESRARGFAAELLLPTAGLRAVLGPPLNVDNASLAVPLVDRARKEYGTSWEIAVNHLFNLGFHSLGPWPWPYVMAGISAVKLEVLLGHRLWPSEQTPRSTTDTGDLERAVAFLPAPVEISSEDPIKHARAARGTAKKLRHYIESEWDTEAQEVVTAFEAQAREAPMKAAVALAVELDRAFEQGRSGFVRAVLHRIEPDKTDGDAMVGMLANVRRPCEIFGAELSDPYRVLVGRTKDALSRTWGWSSEDVADAMSVLS